MGAGLRRAAKRDESEEPIVNALRLLGWSIQRLSIKDAPDLLLARDGYTCLAECKTGNRYQHLGQLNWVHSWRGDVVLFRSVEDALRFHQSSESVRKLLKKEPHKGENSGAQSVLAAPATPLATPHARRQRTA